MLADALLRSLTGTTALFRVTGTNTDTNQTELGLVSTTFANVVISPVAMRKLRPTWQEGKESKWELLVSATGVEQQVNALGAVVKSPAGFAVPNPFVAIAAAAQRQMRQWGDVLGLHKRPSRKAKEPEADQGSGLLKLLGARGKRAG